MDAGWFHAWYMDHSISSSDSLHAVDISVIPILKGKKQPTVCHTAKGMSKLGVTDRLSGGPEATVPATQHPASTLIGPSALPTTIELPLITVQFSLLQTTDFLSFFSLLANDHVSYLQRKQKPSDHYSCSLATSRVNLPASLFRAALWHKAIVSTSEKGTTIR